MSLSEPTRPSTSYLDAFPSAHPPRLFRPVTGISETIDVAVDRLWVQGDDGGMDDESGGRELPPEYPAFLERSVTQFQLLYNEGVAERSRRKAAGEDTRLYDETLTGLAETIEGFWDLLALHRVLAFAKEHGNGPYTVDELSTVTEIGAERLQRIVDRMVTEGIMFLD